MAAVDYFLKIEPIKGESADDKHKGEIDLESWSWGAVQQGMNVIGGGGGAGKVAVQDFHFTTRYSAASPALAQTSGWQVSEVSGDVRAVVNGQTRPVTRGMLLASGSTVASGARARAVLVSGRDYVILSPASRVR